MHGRARRISKLQQPHRRQVPLELNDLPRSPWIAGGINRLPDAETSSEFRRFAVECDRLAQLPEMERHRKILERMAKAWRTLAEEETAVTGFAVQGSGQKIARLGRP